MANQPIQLRIDVTKILKEHLYKGSKGTYLDCAIWPDKEAKFGATHSVQQSVSKEARERGVKGPYIGSMKDDSLQAPRPAQSAPTAPKKASPVNEDCPF